MKRLLRAAALAGASLGFAAHASSATLVGDAISGFAIFPNTTIEPTAEVSSPLTVTDDATDAFRFGFGDRFMVDVNASSVTLTYEFSATFFPVGPESSPGADDSCNCLLLAGLNFSDGSTISGLSLGTATGGFGSFDLATGAEFGTDALANFAFPASPTGLLATLLAGSDAAGGEYVLIDVGGLTLLNGDSLTLGFSTAGGGNVGAVPLPASAWLLIAGIGALGGLSRRRRRAAA